MSSPTPLVGRWVRSVEAAEFLGITPAALSARRIREGRGHPRHVIAGSVVLYDVKALREYRDRWIDGRTR